MSMRINSLFEHDASMKRQAENSQISNQISNQMPSATFEPEVEVQDMVVPKEKSGKGEKGRHRASIACAACRDRRIRCVVPPGERNCTSCKRAKTECIIRNDDERRRPISKAYMSSLADRVQLLESMLAENGKEVPPANYPPKTRTEAPIPESAIENNNQVPQISNQNTTPQSMAGDSTDGDMGYQDNHMSSSIIENPSMPRLQSSRREGLVHKLLSTRGHLSFDQLSGRLRFFGPTANSHIYADTGHTVGLREQPEQVRRTERIIRSLSIETHDYLMNMFWEYYNSVLHIVHKEAFNEDMQSGSTKYYSGFLHISILAMGYRYADLDREDMKMITIANRECTLHREAKYMLDMELERPGGIPSVQAFLLLGDLECGVGRDNTGWMYAGMANRLCFDIGLHLDCRNDGLPEKEVQIRHMTLFACVIYDKYWALFLGRPTGIKSADLEMYRLSKQFACLSACKPAGNQKSLETQIYEELLDLMELAGKIAEIRESSESKHDEDKQNSAYLYVMNLDRQLQTWYRRLPENLVWKPANIQTAPYSFFLLHQQYHCSLILLHRPWAKYEDPTPPTSEDGSRSTEEDEEPFTHSPVDDNHSFMSRSICTRQAIRVARIFWHHRQRFDTRTIFVTGIQHAGTAATALVAALAFIKNVNDRKNNMQYLECLAGALADMASTYQPAASMSGILEAVMCELRSAGKTPPPEFGAQSNPSHIILNSNGNSGARRPSTHRSQSGTSTIPARRESSAAMTSDADEVRTFKKRQLSKSSTRASHSIPTPSSLSNLTNNGNGNGNNALNNPTFSPANGNNNNTSPTQHRTQDGYVLIPPTLRSASERAAWPNLNADLNALDYPMTFTGMGMAGGFGWDIPDLEGGFTGQLDGEEGLRMGGEDMRLAGGDGNGNRQGDEEMGEMGGRKNQELDFFQF